MRIRGIDRWPETQAQLTSVFRYVGRGPKGRPRARAILKFRYTTLTGQDCSGELRITPLSPAYVAKEGETFSIRYDPAQPNRYWCGIPERARGLLLLLVFPAALFSLWMATWIVLWIRQ
jgi:hypothetical protein